ncbi:MAG: DUF5996 family protein, partial [Clostridiales bacterium]
YSYIYPAPKGFDSLKIRPEAASFNMTLGEFILPYKDVYKSHAPEVLIMDFLQSTYNESAKLAQWDIRSFEGPTPF